MAASVTTLAILDGGGSSRNVDVLDLSGAGTGPFIPLHLLYDGTSLATIKAASTPPAATDPAVVVAISPNGQNANGQAAAAASAPVVLASDVANVVGKTAAVAVTPTVTASSAYTAGQEVGGLMTFASVGRSPNNSGILMDVTITSKTVQAGEFDIYWFDSNPSNTTWTDKSTASINAADVSKVRGVTKMTKNYSGLGTHTVYKPDETTWAPMPYVGTTLYGVMVTQGTPTFGSTTDLVVTAQVLQD